jgi:hypothetical protein
MLELTTQEMDLRFMADIEAPLKASQPNPAERREHVEVSVRDTK